MKGKDKCKILKEIRAQIAAANEIDWVIENCTHKGECRGTCPKCEAEVLTLERALARRRALGKSIAVVGLSAGIITTATACSDPTAIEHIAPAGRETDGPTDVVVETRGDLVFAGAPLPPETTVEPDGEVELGGEPLPVYYLTDFELYDSKRSFRAEQGFNLYDVVEDDESPSGVWEPVSAGEEFILLGHNGTDEHEAYLYLVRYKDVLYAIDAYDLVHFATELIPTEDGVAE